MRMLFIFLFVFTLTFETGMNSLLNVVTYHDSKLDLVDLKWLKVDTDFYIVMMTLFSASFVWIYRLMYKYHRFEFHRNSRDFLIYYLCTLTQLILTLFQLEIKEWYPSSSSIRSLVGLCQEDQTINKYIWIIV
jgi:hypothetical protein